MKTSQLNGIMERPKRMGWRIIRCTIRSSLSSSPTSFRLVHLGVFFGESQEVAEKLRSVSTSNPSSVSVTSPPGSLSTSISPESLSFPGEESVCWSLSNVAKTPLPSLIFLAIFIRPPPAAKYRPLGNFASPSSNNASRVSFYFWRDPSRDHPNPRQCYHPRTPRGCRYRLRPCFFVHEPCTC